ncbi:MAG: type II secretion system protein N [Candidatus Oxydemutatoraceae bacterium WSBS_2016_MAG_OTU14]
MNFFSQVSSEVLKPINILASRVVALSLLLFVCYYASTLFWYITYPESLTISFTPNIPKAPAVATQARSWNWFRDTSLAARKPIAQSKINAKLIGVISQDEKDGIALVSVSNKPAEIFRINDEVMPSVFLSKVGPYYIHLENDGAIEVIEMVRKNLFTGDGVGEEKDAENENRPSNNLLEEIAEEPQKLSKIISFKLVKFKGKQGFSVKPKKAEDAGTFEAMGFLPGDIVISADGKPVSELMKDPASWQSLLKSSGIGLQVIRDGIEVDVFVQ